MTLKSFTELSVGGAVGRRRFLQQTAAAGLTLAGTSAAWGAPAKPARPKIAAIITEMRHRTHAHCLLENFLEKYPFNAEVIDPGVDVVSLYVDQFNRGDMAREVAKNYKIPIFNTIAEALTLGGKDLAVDGILGVGEHGKYPKTVEGIDLYPRKRFFDECVAVMKKSNKFVPYFNDKHLTYRWDWAKEMYDTAQQLGIPMMAGSSVPLGQRLPELDLPQGAPMTEALVVHAGELERYGYHGLETLQSMVESRRGGESGISSLELLYGIDALWKGADEKRWPYDLLLAAMEVELGKPYVRNQALPDPSYLKFDEPHVFILKYKDGFKGYVVKLGNNSIRWNFACRIDGDPKIHTTRFRTGPWNNRNLFKAFSHAIQHFFIHRKAPYPVERTLLTTGALAAAVDAWRQKGKLQKTPHLEIAYQTPDWKAFRETGKTWEKFIPAGTPEPAGIHPFKMPPTPSKKS